MDLLLIASSPEWRGSPDLATVEAWSAWWDTLGDLFEAEGKRRRLIESRREHYEAPFAAAIPDMAGIWVPLSNAAVEAVQRTTLRRVFDRRGHAMTSIERTNALLDLVVARSHGRLDNEGEVARMLREDAHKHEGWTVPPRTIADPANPFDRRATSRSATRRSRSGSNPGSPTNFMAINATPSNCDLSRVADSQGAFEAPSSRPSV
jgi:hypothetical protein